MESPGALPWGRGGWFSSWYVVSIDTGHVAQSPQSGPRWSPAFKIEPVLFPPSPGLSMGALQARILEWVAVSFSRGSSQPKDRTQVSRTAGRLFSSRATREAACLRGPPSVRVDRPLSLFLWCGLMVFMGLGWEAWEEQCDLWQVLGLPGLLSGRGV